MSGKFLTKSRHGTTFYFRRRVPTYAQAVIGKAFVLRSLQTRNPRLAVMRGRALAARTDALFLQIEIAKKNGTTGEIKLDCSISIDFGLDGGPPTLKILDVSPDDDPERINSGGAGQNDLTIHIMAAFVEHEAKRISERTKEALAAAKARGVSETGSDGPG